MPNPWLHPVTKIFYLRVRVPADVRQFAQADFVKKSLRTRDPKAAKQRFAVEFAKVQAEWSSLRQRSVPAADDLRSNAAPVPQVVLSEYDAHTLARPVYTDYLSRHVANPRGTREWPSEIIRTAGVAGDVIIRDRSGKLVMSNENELRRRLKLWCTQKSNEILASNGISIDKLNIDKIVYSILEHLKQANDLLNRLARGETELWEQAPADVSVSYTKERASITTSKPNHIAPTSIKFNNLLEGWNLERRLKERTVYEWTNVFRQLEDFVGHDDASKLTVDDLRRWKTKMLEDNLSAKTIRDAKLAPVKAVLNWAVQNGKIDKNPAEKVSIEVRRRAGEGRRSFDDAEARKLLDIAQQETDPIKRWIPWICAYTGARLSEVCQLRVSDVVQIGTIWAFRISAEAGSLKNYNSERVVPIHSKLISSGFLDFVHSVETDILFSSLPPDKFGKRGGNGTKVLGRWIRKLGFDDPRLGPNHSWRHRFKTLARRYSIPSNIADAIAGHRQRTVGDDYGEFEVETMWRELEKLP